MRIVYCLNTISVIGGVEAVSVTKANALAAIPGNKVWMIICGSSLAPPAFNISGKVELLSIDYRITWAFPLNLLQIAKEWGSLRKQLQEHLNRIQPDIVVSTGGFDKWLVPFTRGRWAFVREVHGVKSYRRKEKGSFLKKKIATLGEWLDYHFLVTRVDRIVVLTQEDRITNWKDNPKIDVIPNPVRFENDLTADVSQNKRILAAGRLTYQKNFSSLIRAFRRIANKYPEWTLVILGEGEERILLENLIDSLSLQRQVLLPGNVSNVRDWMFDSSMFALSSRTEGLPLVLIEAMSVGLPVISYSCPTGPKDVISNGIDGYLVPPENEEVLAERIATLIEDPSLRKRMSIAAIEKSKRFSIDQIIRQWCLLFDELCKDNTHI